MRKFLSLCLALMMLLGIGGALAEGSLVGGWTAAEDPAITDDVNALIEKALDGLVGVNYVPVAYLGSQVVAGTNHAILCLATAVVPDAVPAWTILYLYEDLTGNVSILRFQNVTLSAQGED